MQTTSKRTWRPILAVIVSMLVASCASDAPTAARSLAAPSSHPVADVSGTTDQALYTQSPFHFGSLLDRVTFRIADDFTVPAGANWIVTKIVLVGRSTSSVLDFDFVRDDGGVPGSTPLFSGTAAVGAATADPCCGGVALDYPLELGPYNLPPGTYWFVIRGTNIRPWPTESRVGSWAVGASATVANWSPLSTNTDLAFAVFGTLETPQSAASGLSATIDDFKLDFGTATSFHAKLNASMASLGANDTAGACDSLQDFLNAANAQSQKKLTAQQAADLIAGARKIRSLVGC